MTTHILFYDDAPNLGGHELMTLQLVEKLAADARYRVTFVVSQHNQALQQQLRRFAPAVRLQLTTYTSGRGQWLRTYGSVLALGRLTSRLRAERPDLLLVVQGGIALSSLALLAGRLARVRTVSYLPMAHAESMFTDQPWLARLRQFFVQPFYALPHCLVTISPRMVTLASSRRSGAVKMVENGINLPQRVATDRQAVRSALGLSADEQLLLMVGRIEFSQKRHDLAVQALALARSRGQDLHLLLVGSGPDEAALRAQVQALGLNPVVHWRPWQDAVAPFYAACDALLLPSRYEGVPLVMLEALYAGRQVLASDVDGMADMLPAAWTFPSGNVQALAQLLGTLAPPHSDGASQQLSKQLSQHHRLIATRHTTAAFTDRFMQLIDAEVRLGAGSARTRVAVVEPVGGHGGMNFYDQSLCQGLVQAGGQATLYTCDQTTLTGEEGFPIQRPYRQIFGASPAWRRGLRFVRGSLRALLQARASGHRVAHFHFFHVGPLELFNVGLARCLGLRVVVTAHDVEAFKQGLTVPRFMRWAYGAAHRVIAHSQIAQRELVEQLLLPPNKVEVILHGNYVASVPLQVTPAVARAHLGLASDKRVLLFFGQIKDVKGLDVLLQGFALARQTDPQLHLVIAGRVWKTDFAPYQDLINRLQLAPFCSLHIRYIADAEVAYFYRSADLVVLPYLRIYQSGVVLQAMSHGCAVLVSDIEGLLEAVADEQTGFVFKSRDPSHLAQRLADIFANPALTQRVAQAGLQQVLVRNDWASLGAQTLACYGRAQTR